MYRVYRWHEHFFADAFSHLVAAFSAFVCKASWRTDLIDGAKHLWRCACFSSPASLRRWGQPKFIVRAAAAEPVVSGLGGAWRLPSWTLTPSPKPAGRESLLLDITVTVGLEKALTSGYLCWNCGQLSVSLVHSMFCLCVCSCLCLQDLGDNSLLRFITLETWDAFIYLLLFQMLLILWGNYSFLDNKL